MKHMVGLFVVGLIAIIAITFLNVKEMDRDHGQWIMIAYGPPSGSGEMPLHAVVTMGMPRVEPPEMAENGAVLWNEWIDDHFELVDASGEAVRLRRIGSTRLISDRQAMNAEFFLEGRVKANHKYIFNYIPVKTGTQKYRLEFTSPPGEREGQREQFLPV